MSKILKEFNLTHFSRNAEALIIKLVREKGYRHTEALIMALNMVEYFHQLVSHKILEKPVKHHKTYFTEDLI